MANLSTAERDNRVRTGPGKPGKSWNLIIWIPGLETHVFLSRSWKVMEYDVGKCMYGADMPTIDVLCRLNQLNLSMQHQSLPLF